LKRALVFCEAKPGEQIFDIGSGDGWVLITAVKDYGLVETGVEIDTIKVWLANLGVRFAGVQDCVKIVRANIFDTNYRKTDILFIYLTHQAIDQLFPKILK